MRALSSLSCHQKVSFGSCEHNTRVEGSSLPLVGSGMEEVVDEAVVPHFPAPLGKPLENPVQVDLDRYPPSIKYIMGNEMCER